MLIPVVLRKKRDDWTTHKLSRNVGVEVTPSENLATVPRANDKNEWAYSVMPHNIIKTPSELA